MTDLFDHADQAAQLRDAGMGRATDAQESKQPGWSDLAFAVIVMIARRQPEMHVDDVLSDFPMRPQHFNAWGQVWRRAIMAGVIRNSGRVRPCADVRKHRHQSPIYTSLVYQGGSDD